VSWWKEKEKIINNCWKPSAIDWNETKRLHEGKDKYIHTTDTLKKKEIEKRGKENNNNNNNNNNENNNNNNKSWSEDLKWVNKIVGVLKKN
jgi:hypothetical protein